MVKSGVKHQMECRLDAFHMSIWEGTQRKHWCKGTTPPRSNLEGGRMNHLSGPFLAEVTLQTCHAPWSADAVLRETQRRSSSELLSMRNSYCVLKEHQRTLAMALRVSPLKRLILHNWSFSRRTLVGSHRSSHGLATSHLKSRVHLNATVSPLTILTLNSMC